MVQINSLCPSDARHMATLISVKISSGNVLLIDQAITWTNVDLSSVRSSDNYLWPISQDIPQPSTIKIRLKVTYLKFHSDLPGASELRMVWSDMFSNVRISVYAESYDR